MEGKAATLGDKQADFAEGLLNPGTLTFCPDDAQNVEHRRQARLPK